jgi:hypothetical protein
VSEKKRSFPAKNVLTTVKKEYKRHGNSNGR